MSHNPSNSNTAEKIETPDLDIDETIHQDYKKLNEKCDKVITKIKNRKENKPSSIR